MAKYIEVKNDKNMIQLDDSYKPLILTRKGNIANQEITKKEAYKGYKNQMSIKIPLLENEYNIAIRNNTDTQVSYFSTLVIDPQTRQRYVAIEIIGQDETVINSLEYYVFGQGQIIPMNKGDVGLEIKNDKGEVIYNSKTPVAKIIRCETGCAVPTYHTTDNELVWDVGILRNSTDNVAPYMSGFTPRLDTAWKNTIKKYIPRGSYYENGKYKYSAVSQREFDKEWERIDRYESNLFTLSFAYEESKKIAIMVNRLPRIFFKGYETYWSNTGTVGIIKLDNVEANLSYMDLNFYHLEHLPWDTCLGPQPMYSLIAVDVTGC